MRLSSQYRPIATRCSTLTHHTNFSTHPTNVAPPQGLVCQDKSIPPSNPTFCLIAIPCATSVHMRIHSMPPGASRSGLWVQSTWMCPIRGLGVGQRWRLGWGGLRWITSELWLWSNQSQAPHAILHSPVPLARSWTPIFQNVLVNIQNRVVFFKAKKIPAEISQKVQKQKERSIQIWNELVDLEPSLAMRSATHTTAYRLPRSVINRYLIPKAFQWGGWMDQSCFIAVQGKHGRCEFRGWARWGIGVVVTMREVFVWPMAEVYLSWEHHWAPAGTTLACVMDEHWVWACYMVLLAHTHCSWTAQTQACLKWGIRCMFLQLCASNCVI